MPYLEPLLIFDLMMAAQVVFVVGLWFWFGENAVRVGQVALG